MEDFKSKLKSLTDNKLNIILSENKPTGKAGTIENVQNSLTAFGKMTELSSNMIVEEANKLYPEMGIEKDVALNVVQEIQREYLGEIKKAAGY